MHGMPGHTEEEAPLFHLLPLPFSPVVDALVFIVEVVIFGIFAGIVGVARRTMWW